MLKCICQIASMNPNDLLQLGRILDVQRRYKTLKTHIIKENSTFITKQKNMPYRSNLAWLRENHSKKFFFFMFTITAKICFHLSSQRTPPPPKKLTFKPLFFISKQNICLSHHFILPTTSTLRLVTPNYNKIIFLIIGTVCGADGSEREVHLVWKGQGRIVVNLNNISLIPHVLLP